jgi:AmmeMemoRadiSam system protein A
MGDQRFDTCHTLAGTLARCIRGKSVLLIASTDLSHFHSYHEAKKLDAHIIERVMKMDAEGLHSDLAKGICEACGGGPMVATMLASRRLGANDSRILFAANSGDVTGDHSRVVGYMAAALWSKSADKPVLERKTHLTPKEKEALLQIARQSVEACVTGSTVVLPNPLMPALKSASGAFVTLRKHEKLRGCMGRLSSNDSLAGTVHEMAAAAAMKDPRFPSVRKEELKDLEYEISVLTPLRLVTDIREIRLGTHGIFIKKGRQQGALLPQVAERYRWDRIAFLEQTCRKARLPKDAWKDLKTEIYIFSAEVF